MVGLSRVPAIEVTGEEQTDSEGTQSISNSKNSSVSVTETTFEPCFQELENFSFLPDFESIEGWFKDYTDLSDGGVLNFCEVGNDNFDVKGEVAVGFFMAEGGDNAKASTFVNGFHTDSKVIETDEKLNNFAVLIEKGMENVSLDGVSKLSEGLDHVEDVNVVNEHEHVDNKCLKSGDTVNVSDVRTSVTNATENSVKTDDDDDDEESDDENNQSSSSTSCSSSSSDSSDSEENKVVSEATVEEDTEIEEGEIMLQDAEKMTSWSDNEDGDYDEVEGRAAEPIRSKNGIEAINLPVPPVTVSLQPHHLPTPVGTILSIIGSKVIVEGVEKHNPLSEGSILWINETRLPLGIVDEIFGPVKNPYYVVRYNSDDEVPHGIGQGTVISFVEEFAEHVLNDKNLYRKGYDASGENDEEVSDEVEFSDDEEEAEYKRMQKMKKRDVNESRPENKGKEKKRPMNRKKNWKQNQTSSGIENEPVDQKSHSSPAVLASTSVFNQHLASLPPNNTGIWNNNFPYPPQNPSFWMQPNQPSQTFQFPIQSNLPIQQQIGVLPTMPLNFNMGLQPNQGFLPPWPTGLDPNMLSMLQFQMGVNSLQTPPLQTGVSNLQPSPLPFGNNIHVNQGRGGGRRGHRGGGRGHFRGGRGNNVN